MVVSADPLATRAGVKILRQGGNAVDAAVATALTLGVTSFAFSGIGGGGFVLFHQRKSGKNIVVDYRETAPLRTRPDLFTLDSMGEVKDQENSIGSKAIATPATLLGLSLALEKFGTKRFVEVSKDAVDLARRGFEINRFLSRAMATQDSLAKFHKFKESSKIVLRPNSKEPLKQGDRISLPNLAKLISSIGNGEVREFYEMKFAKSISEFIQSRNGLLSDEDFKRYEVRIREPLVSKCGNYEVVSIPPPSAGGICLIQLLKMILNKGDLDRDDLNSARNVDTIAKCLGLVYNDRTLTVADPDFENVDVGKLICDSYVSRLFGFLENKPNKFASHEGSQTSHLTVVDSAGNIVALTESIECYFGSGILLPEFDLFLNDTMHDFDPQPNTINSIKPLKRPRSAMSPTILLKDGEPFLALGGAGGLRITSSVLQVILNVTEHGMNIGEAMRSERIHYYDGILYSENLKPQTKAHLKSMGYTIDDSKPDYFFGGVNAIQFSDGKIEGAADPRRDGLALGSSVR